MSVDYIGFLFALIVTAGGIAGYVKAQSIPSLAAGLVFGISLAIGAYQSSLDKTNCVLAIGTSMFMFGIMGFRSYASGKFVPPGLIAVLSLINIMRLFLRSLGAEDKDE